MQTIEMETYQKISLLDCIEKKARLLNASLPSGSFLFSPRATGFRLAGSGIIDFVHLFSRQPYSFMSEGNKAWGLDVKIQQLPTCEGATMFPSSAAEFAYEFDLCAGMDFSQQQSFCEGRAVRPIVGVLASIEEVFDFFLAWIVRNSAYTPTVAMQILTSPVLQKLKTDHIVLRCRNRDTTSLSTLAVLCFVNGSFRIVDQGYKFVGDNVSALCSFTLPKVETKPS